MLLSNNNISTGAAIGIFVAIIVVGTIIYMIKDHFDTKKGVDSEEKKFIFNLIQNIVPAGEQVTAAYAHFETTQYGGGGRRITETTTYRYYAVGFNDERIYVVPLSHAGGELSYKDTFVINKNELGMVNGFTGGDWMTLYDKTQKELITIRVTASNTKEDKYHPVNIQQPEEAKAFGALVNKWLNEVNAANGVTVTGKWGKPVKK